MASSKSQASEIKPWKRKQKKPFPKIKKDLKPKTFADALKEKYCDFDDFDSNSSDGFIIDIVVRGKPKVKNDGTGPELGFLTNAVLNNSLIGSIGSIDGGLAALCPNIVDLDVASNNLTDWSELLTMMSQLPKLAFLNLSQNNLKSNSNKEALMTCRERFPSMRNMVLNGTFLPWEDISVLTTLVPNLKELHLCRNDYTHVEGNGLSGFHSIECLRLNDNKIEGWEEVWKLHTLPQLKSLILSGNALRDIYYVHPTIPKYSCDNVEDETSAEEGSVPGEQKEGILVDASATTAMNTDNTPKPSDNDKQNNDGLCNLSQETLETDAKDVNIMSIVKEGDASSDVKPQDSALETLNDVKSEDITPDSLNDEKPKDNAQDSLKDANPEDNALNSSNDVESEANVPEDAVIPKIEASPLNSDVNPPFSKLESLCLSDTWVNKWEHLHSLNKFPQLKAVRLKSIPLAQEIKDEDRRKLYVASLPKISTLNGSEVTSTEREKAERHFLRHFSEDDKPERFHELEAKHGKLEPLVDIILAPRCKPCVKVKIIHEGKVACEPVLKTRDTVLKIKSQIIRMLKLTKCYQARYLDLYLVSVNGNKEPELITLMNSPLSLLDIVDGDEFHVSDSYEKHPFNINFCEVPKK
ncbi:unnamed protein product [Owenia fusiformis]|uniref:Tubulin-specific chaperone cofactor E-like protein n=1 Tax=Owenia fusiformis TaxID=6347 RepID=A0A8S4N247_OWEFU|nr:unnamed protein product [Owenia fusiformis]